MSLVTEAQRLIEAASKRGRYPFRDRVLVRMTSAIAYLYLVWGA
jgi:hypothetical protein